MEHCGGRLVSTDVMKGLIATAIVFIHIFVLVPKDGTPGMDADIAEQILYLGLMLFFIISEYFYRPGRTAVQNIVRRMKQLLPPIILGLILLPSILYVYLAIFGQGPTVDELVTSYLRIFGSINVLRPLDSWTDTQNGLVWIYNGYYFLQIMLGAFIVFYMLVDYARKDARIEIVIVSLLLLAQALIIEFVDIVFPFWFNLVPIAAAFMFVEEAASRLRILEHIEECSLGNRKFWISLVGSAAVLVSICILLPPGTRFERYRFGDYGGWSAFPYFIESCIATYVYTCLSKLISMIPVLCRPLSVMGRHTLGIICLHLFVIKVLIAPFLDLTRVAALPKLSTAEGILAGVLTLSIIALAAEYLLAMMRKIGGKKDRETAVGSGTYNDRP